MKKSILAVLAILIWASPTPAYIDHFGLYTLRSVIEQSPDIAVLRVEKISREKGVVIFSKVADLKGKYPAGESKHQISEGFRAREPRLILNWAEPGRTVVVFSNGATAQVCAGSYWYEVAARKDAPGWWGLTHVQSILAYAYCGSVEKLKSSVSDMIAGKETVIPAVRYSGDSNTQRLATFKNVFRGKDAILIRMKASLKMANSPLDGLQIVGMGGGGPEDLPALVEALKKTDPQVRRSAAEELGRVGAPALPALLAPLKDADARVRVAAAGAALAIDPKQAEAFAVLLESLKDPGAAVRRLAAEALAAVGPEAGAAGSALSDLLGDKEEEVRWAAADALGELGPAAAPAVPALLKLLGDKDPAFRGVAADALGQGAKANPAAVSGALSAAFKDADRRVRESAARSFLELGLRSRDAVAILAASKDDPWVYAVTLAFLVRSGGPEAGPFVLEGIKHPNWEVRLAASNLLLQVDAPSLKPALGLLIEGLKDPSYFVSARCARVLFAMAPEGKQAAPALLQLLKHPDKDFWEPRSYAAVALAKMGTKEKAMLPALIEGVQQPAYKEVRLHAARTLGEMGAEATPALGALREVAKDKDAEVAKAAADALARIEAARKS
ncbi:MAG TPA: HEAT repeat domain-containing protein [Planctomycetota bacterium]|nr:HEAT repeat domain-containing protein [Planctomycetota bacterium]